MRHGGMFWILSTALLKKLRFHSLMTCWSRKNNILIILEDNKNTNLKETLLDLSKKSLSHTGSPGTVRRVRHWCSMLPPRGVSVGEILTGVLAGSEVSCGWTFNMWRAVFERQEERRRGPCCCCWDSLVCLFPASTTTNYYYKLISLLIKEVTVSMHNCTDSLMVRSQTARASVGC